MKKIRILLADDHSLVRIGLKTLLNAQCDLDVVDEASDGDEAVCLYDKLSPDVVIMDLLMTCTDGAEATRLIRERHPDSRIIILTSYTTSADLARALSYGAVGAQLKGSSTDGLLDAIRSVARGETAIDPEVSKLVRSQKCPPPADGPADRHPEGRRRRPQDGFHRRPAGNFRKCRQAAHRPHLQQTRRRNPRRSRRHRPSQASAENVIAAAAERFNFRI